MKSLPLFCFTALFALPCAFSTVYLTGDDFESETSGQKAIVAFKAPWCGHCKKLKPEWDKLADEVDALIGEVDCTVEKKLCSEHGVQGYPTIKWSTGYGWNKYEQARDFASLKSFVESNLVDGCFDDESLCTESDKKTIEELRELSSEEIATRLQDTADQKAAAEVTFKSGVEKLQERFKELQSEKQTTLDGLLTVEGFLKYVQKTNDVVEAPKEDL